MDRSIGDMPTLPGGSDHSWKGILQPGSSFGRYKVHCFLGRGGMGEVYDVEHELDGTHYAMKVLSSEIRQTPENIRRFEREAQVMARLRHPNVVSVDYFDETDGKYWFRMELARGIEEGVVTLGDLAAKNGGRIGQGLLVGLFEHILDGLSCAHKAGVIHRDLKPGNILLVLSNETTGGIIPKISDFGLVRLVGQDWLLKKTLLSAAPSRKEGGIDATMDSQGVSTQSLVGTYAYMSPEQKQRKDIDARSDIYAVGLMIYRLLTGYTNPGEKIRNKDSTLHAFWQRIIDQSVREDPGDRFSDVAAMLEEMQRGRRVLASLDGKASLEKCRVELLAKRCYTANRYLDEAVMIFPSDPEVLEFSTFMREQLSLLHDLKKKMQDLRRQKKYDEALAVAEQFRAICIEEKQINTFIDECPQLIAGEQLKQLIEKASRFLEAGEYEAASRAAQKALSLDDENSQAKRINDQALAGLKKLQMEQTREEVNHALQKTYSLLKKKHYAQALDALNHSPCSDSNHPKVVALRNACQEGLEKVRRYWERAEKAKASCDNQGAMDVLSEALESVAPEDPGTLERLHQIRNEVKELSAAETDMDRAWKNKCYKNCLEAAERILAIKPDHTRARQIKPACLERIRAIRSVTDQAEEYYRNQQYDEAVAAFEQTRRFYCLGKRRSEGDSAVETQQSIYSPEYKEIRGRIAAARQAKTSMEQALRRAKDRLEAGDLVEARLSLDEYFELQANGEEGSILQQKLEGLYRHAMIVRWIRRSLTYLAVVSVIGIGLAYGTASLVLTHRAQKELEASGTGLTFANLAETRNKAGLKLADLKRSWLIPFSSIEARWQGWTESLLGSEGAWEDYTRGAYEEGRKKIQNTVPVEFRPWIQNALDIFVQEMNVKCADANEHLVSGRYDTCMTCCNALLLDYPQHHRVLQLLQEANKARELEKYVYDTNDLIRLSDSIGQLIEISPQHRDRRKLETHCIQKVKSECGFLDQPLPTENNAVVEHLNLCRRAQDVVAAFKQCSGYQALSKELTDREEQLKDQLIRVRGKEGYRDTLNEVMSTRRDWIEAKRILDTLSSAQPEVVELKSEVDRMMNELDRLVQQSNKLAEQDNWFDAGETIGGGWSLWGKDNRRDLLQEAKDLTSTIKVSVQNEQKVIDEFSEMSDRKSHDQIQRFILERIDHNLDLRPVYAKWFPRLNREVQDGMAQDRITTALKLLNGVLDNNRIISDANQANGGRLLSSLRANRKLAERRFKSAQELIDKARPLQANRKYPEALWCVHQALKMDCEYESARRSLESLRRRERVATQYWQDAKALYDDKCYFEAGRSLKVAIQEFPDLRVLALSRDLDTRMKEAEKAKDNVLKRKMPVEEFYDTYPDYDEFPSDADKRLRKAVLQDLKNRLGNLSQEKMQIIVKARRSILQDEGEYQALDKKYSSGMREPLLSDRNIANADWCQLEFPRNNNLTLYIEGHGVKAWGTALVRCQDKMYIQVSKSSDPSCSRTGRLALQPWKKHRIEIKPSCFSVKTAKVQVVKKGWLFKDYDWDAMANQIMKEHKVDQSTAKKSLQMAFDVRKDKGNVITLEVPLIDCWDDEQFMEITLEE